MTVLKEVPMLREWIYPKIEGLLKKGAAILHKQGITANQLTIAGLVLNLVAACFLLNGQFILGGIMIFIAGAGDVLDGALARHAGTSSPYGAFLDSFVDRYSEFFLYGGLALHYARADQGLYLVLTLGVLAGSYAVSYSKARAENFIENCGVGIFDRGVRILVLLLGTLLPFLLPLVLWILCIGSNYTAMERFFHTKKQLNGEAGPAENNN